MKSHSNKRRAIALVVCLVGLSAIFLIVGVDVKMNSEPEKVEELRVQFEDELMRVEGVVSISIGLCGDRPCLKVGTSEPIEDVRPRLPENLQKNEDVELEYIGDVEAQ
ncbi:hypothetical protein AB2B41_05885 [Marimonas sp. MJW-29]|uniref:Uncharacterized protein n=1 Tax=Sulfitobacter sediminis TaxID=3234186 RepID=A0ABV3RJG7_9RHOB